ncbi:epidermal growth factor receptor substrate 15-like 1 isoform X3 [Chrysoperla carnea]|nr:epidermal growth factor receptor substrate 15-like 1 isoform X3 [Chrysoperla carnea]
MGKDLNMINVALETPPPKMGDPPPKLMPPSKPPPPSISPTPPTPLITALPPTTGDWSIKPSERAKYDQLFDSLQPLNGMIPGNKVKGVLMESKLPLDTLGKIWDLADIDKDGMLDRHEFVVAMHLVYKALEKHAIPATLPQELMPPNKKITNNSPLTTINTSTIRAHPPPGRPMVPPMQASPLIPLSTTQSDQIQPLQQQVIQPLQQQVIQPLQQQQPPVIPIIPWVVNNEDKTKYDAMFLKADVDQDGYVNGFEIKDVFLQSGVPQPILAHIWALCDIKQTGKLNNEQFALAMWMVNRKLLGVDPPPALSPDMVPPSMRPGGSENSTHVEQPTVTPYSNPELDMISKDIEELAKEKLILETDIAQKEADIKIKGGEIKSLQSELDTLTAALKQLENQKGEAQKRLNDLKTQRAAVDTELADVLALIEVAQDEVDKLRIQAEEQENTLRSQESEVSKKREQLESIRQEQAQLEMKKNESSRKLNNLAETLADTQLQISQAKAKITQLQEQQRLMKDAINACDYAIENSNPSLVPDTSLRITPEFRDPEFTRVAPIQKQTNDNTSSINTSNTKADPFSNQNGHTNTSGFDDDPFKSDPFKSTNNSNSAFESNDPFASSFSKSDGFGSDPFAASFGGGNSNNNGKVDPFDPFGDKSRANAKSPAVDSEKDPFGCDPFAILHAPTRDSVPPGRPTSPSPALPPKVKGKTPPPRPAPPRPLQGPTGRMSNATTPDPFSAPGSQNDPFGGGSGGGGFADFADFDAKFSKQTAASVPQKPPPPSITLPKTTKLEFTDDPFRDYRYEDPFNIADPFDDDTTGSSSTLTDDIKNSNLKVDAFGFAGGAISTTSSDVFTTDFENDIKSAETIPLRKTKDGRTSVPLFSSSTNDFQNAFNNNNINGRSSAQDPFFASGDNSFNNNNVNKKTVISEDQQLAWAAAESLKAEEERKRRQEQEQADLEYALALSKAEAKS